MSAPTSRRHPATSACALAAGVAAAALALTGTGQDATPAPASPVRVLFLGHDSEHHNSNEYYPMIAEALGRDAIYFDYVTEVADALGDPDYLNRFDGLLLYANHDAIEPEHYQNLKAFVESGKGFIPVHSASYCFRNEPGFIEMVGGQFAHHKTGVFSTDVVKPDHPAMGGVEPFEAWDETYVHTKHGDDRDILMVRRPSGDDDNITEPEPWTWVRTQGEGRVFYTASGHDERVWGEAGFHQLIKAGILWAIGDERRAGYERFVAGRAPLRYEKRDNIPNYERRPEPLPYQFPLSPEDSMDYTRAPVGFRLELFASEPDIINPIGLAWDERGRLWCAETVDYPNELTRDRKGNDKIKILEDTDGDGRCDKVTVFADGLNIPTSLAFANGGVIVTHAPEILFFEDTDGDDRADVRTTIMTGWGIGDTHAGPSNLRYGLDNWVYGTVGYSGFNGSVGGEDQRFGMGVFRFKPDGSDLEFLHQFNNNTWGLGFNEAGDVFGSTANNNPSFFGGTPATLLDDQQGRRSAEMIASDPSFHPITPNIRQVDAFGAYTAGAGHAFATSAAFPEGFRDEIAFLNGPTGNLVGMYRIKPDGAGYDADNAYAFLASADEWFSPVAAEIGPDGHLWVADWYNFIVQHNPTPSPERGGYAAENGRGNAHINPLRDREHGRIYRVVWDGAPASAATSLGGASPADLVAALDSDNQFWRLTAQRLLVDGKTNAAVPALKERVKSDGALGAAHALWALQGLGELDQETHQFALLSNDPTLRRNAIRALGDTAEDVQLFFDTAVVTDANPVVRLAAFNKLASFPPTDTTKLAAQQLMADPANASDPWLAQALELSGATAVDRGPATLGPNLIANGSFEDVDGDTPTGWAVRTYSGSADHSIANGGRTGQRSVLIESLRGADSSFFTDVAVKPDTEYELSAWIKTDRLAPRRGGRGAQLNVHALPGQPRTPALRGDNDWTEVKVRFESGNATEIGINALYGGWGHAVGRAWWDDVSLNEVTYAPVASGAAGSPEGDPERGRALFNEHPVAACSRCHIVGGAGGVVGPALDGIASRKDETYLLESLVDPGATIAENYQAEVSPMPPMGILLTPQELADVLAYVMTLTDPAVN